ncbi:MAG: 16S rRNA (guanine(527)-N(7))-methyltransferase RsmG [Spirochaetes bacterium]|nr:16S rRNA (guanine(527)-N(7))-methyltransferase RsmG [Spirochaetota bacterium]
MFERYFKGDQYGLARINEFIRLIDKWNKKINLVSYKNTEELKTKHILDSLTLLDIFSLEKGQVIIDLGTGCGFPGMVLAIACPENKFLLVESKKKYYMFLKKAVQVLNLNNVILYYGRLQSFPELRQKADAITTRAVGDIATITKEAAPFLKENGMLVFYKGKNVFQELEEHKVCIKEQGFVIKALAKSKVLEKQGMEHFILVLEKN